MLGLLALASFALRDEVLQHATQAFLCAALGRELQLRVTPGVARFLRDRARLFDRFFLRANGLDLRSDLRAQLLEQHRAREHAGLVLVRARIARPILAEPGAILGDDGFAGVKLLRSLACLRSAACDENAVQ